MNDNLRLNSLLPYFLALTIPVFFVFRLILVFSDSNDLSGVEQNVIYSIQHLIDNGKLYSSPSSAPFSITQYTPLFYYLCGFSAELIGFGSENIRELYVIGRLWNIIINFTTAVFIYKIAREVLGLPRNAANFLFGMSFILSLPHNFAVRPDSLHDMFGLVSIYYFLKYSSSNKDNLKSYLMILLAVLTSALALFSKQSGIQLIIIFIGYSIISLDYKTCLKLLLVTVLVYGGFILFFDHIYDSFWMNVVGGVNNGYRIESLFYILRKGLFIFILLPPTIIFLYFVFSKNLLFKGKPAERLLAISALGTLIFAAATSLKLGSTSQYFTLFLNLSLLLIVLEFYKISLAPLSKPFLKYKYIIICCYVIGATLLCGLYAGNLIYDFSYKKDIISSRNAANKVIDFISSDRGTDNKSYIFADLTNDATLPSRQNINNFFYQTALVPQLDIVQTSNIKSTILGYKAFEDMLSSGEIKYLIDPEIQTGPVIFDNLEKIKKSHFKIIKKIDGFRVYKFSPYK